MIVVVAGHAPQDLAAARVPPWLDAHGVFPFAGASTARDSGARGKRLAEAAGPFVGVVAAMAFGIVSLHQAGELVGLKQPVEGDEPTVKGAVAALQELGARRGLQRGPPAVEPAALAEPRHQRDAPRAVQEHHLGPALARRRLVPEREGLVDVRRRRQAARIAARVWRELIERPRWAGVG
jgi:hypothetical protein